MDTSILGFLDTYGYLAIFILIFIIEIGVPLPIPSELLLIYAGIASVNGPLTLPVLLIVAVSADFLGALLLYFIFSRFGFYFKRNRNRYRFCAFVVRMGEKAEQYMGSKTNKLLLFLRLTPLIRGYVSVGAGICRFQTSRYLPIALLSSSIVCTMYVCTGILLATHFYNTSPHLLYIFPAIAVAVIIILVKRQISKPNVFKENNNKLLSQGLTIHMVSETAFGSQGQGVHTAFLEMKTLISAEESMKVLINGEGYGDIFHSHTYGPYYFWKGRKYPNRKILTAHVIPSSSKGSIPFASLLMPLTRLYLKQVYRYADTIIAISPEVEREIRALGVKTPIVRINNPILHERWNTNAEMRIRGRERLGIMQHKKIILGVGQLQARKGIEDFIDIAQALPQYEFVWVGGRPMGIFTEGIKRINNKIAQAPSNITFVGLVDNEEMPVLYAAADVFLFPSYQENCPLAPMEAAASGLPVIFRDIPEYRLLFESPYLNATNNIDFVNIIKKLLLDEEYYSIGKVFSATFVTFFSRDTIKEKIIELYRNLWKAYQEDKHPTTHSLETKEDIRQQNNI